MKIGRADPIIWHFDREIRLGFLDRLMIKDEKEGSNFNRRMFNEDFANIFRSRNLQNGKLFEILSSDDDLTKRLLGNAKPSVARRLPDEALRDMVEKIAQSLTWFGAAYYLIHDRADLEAVHVASLGTAGVFCIFGLLFQWVPSRTKRHWKRVDKELSREIRILNRNKVMRFILPKPLSRVLHAQNRTLAVLDKHLFGVTDLQPHVSHENPNPTNYFDFNVWRETQELALYRATRATGWDGRKYDSSKRSDFFDCHRLIRFRRNQLSLRDEILKQLSAELSRVGKCYNAEYTVKISGTVNLPTIEFLNELEARLTREEVSFEEIVDYCLEA